MNIINNLRFGLLTILMMVVTSALGETLILNTNAITVNSNAQDRTFIITSDQSWTVTSSDTWLAVSPESGTGDSTITLHADENTSTSNRIATITITGGSLTEILTFTQIGKFLELVVSPDVISYDKEGGNKTINVASNVTWKAESSESWLTVSDGSGTGNGTVTLSSSAYSGNEPRSATVIITGQGLTRTVSVTQLGDQLALEVTPTSISFTKEGGNKTFEVASNITWEAESSESWLTVSDGSGTGNGTVTLTSSAYTGNEPRYATVTITGEGLTRTVSVTQLGDQLSLEVTPMSISFTKEGGNKTFEVASNITWEAESSETWLTISDGSGTGNGTVMLTSSKYTGNEPRTATVTITGQGLTRSVSVTQLGDQLALEVTPTSISYTKGGGNKTFEVASNITWTAESSETWLTISGGSGSDNGTVTLKAAAYTGNEPRIATVTITGQGLTRTVSVTQLGDQLALEVTPTSISFTKEGGNADLNVASNVKWTAKSNETWLTVSGRSVTGNGSVTLKAAAYTGNEPRSATVTISGQGLARTVSVTQLGDQLTLEVTPTSISFTKEGGNANFNVASNVKWTAKSNETWLTVSGGSGTGNGNVTLTSSVYTGNEPRIATVTITGEGLTRTISVTQLGDVLALEVTPTSISFAKEGGNADFNVASNVKWTVKSSETWLTISGGTGIDNGTVTLKAAAYTGNEPRIATVTITGQGLTRTVSVTQLGDQLALEVTPTSISFTKEGGNADLNVASNVKWTVKSSETWLTISGGTGIDNGTVTLKAAAYTGNEPRIATVTITGQGLTRTVSVTQLGDQLALEVTPTSISFTKEGGNADFNVASNVKWTAKSNETWLTVSGGSGTGNGTVTLTSSVYTGNEPRIATVTITGEGLTRTISVTQLGDVLALEVTPTSISFTKEGGIKTFEVASNVTWEANSSETWLSVSEGNGTGNGTVTLKAAAYSGNEPRSATVTITGQGLTRTVCVTQLGDVLALEVTPMSISFDKTGGTKHIYIACNVSWEITCEENWFTISQVKGDNNAEISVNAEPNVKSNLRRAVVFIKGLGIDEPKQVVVTQFGDVTDLSVDRTEIRFGKEGGSANISIASNTKWMISCPDTWVKIKEPENGKGAGNLTTKIDVEKINSRIQRSATVTIELENGSQKKEIHIIQSGDGFLSANPTTINYTVKEGIQEFNILSNVKWEVAIKDNLPWLNVSKPANKIGEGNSTVSIHADFNSDTRNNREGIVCVKYLGPDGDSIVQDIRIVQDRCPIVPSKLQLDYGWIAENGVESTIGETVELAINSTTFDNKDKWIYTWIVDGEKQSSNSNVLYYDKEKFNVKKVYNVNVEVSYQDDPDNKLLKKALSFKLYPSPKSPTSLKKVGNGAGGQMYAEVSDVNEERLKTDGYRFVFGYNIDNQDGEATFSNNHTYKDKTIVNNEAIRKWVYTEWDLDNRTIKSKKMCISDGTTQNNPVSEIVVNVNSLENNELLLRNGMFIANVSTPVPAIINVISLNGHIVRNIKLAPSQTFNEMLDFNGLPAGIYIVKCSVGSQHVEQKIILK